MGNHFIRLARSCLRAAAIMFAAVALQAHAAAPSTLRFERLGAAAGLPQEMVNSLAQDGQGFIWLGGQGGLSRFDGYRMTVFTHADGDPASLVDNWIQALHADGKGGLWVGTHGGLQRYDPRTERFTTYQPGGGAGASLRDIQCITGDGAGGLWIGTTGGVRHLDPASGRFSAPPALAALDGETIFTIARDRRGRLWLGGRTGVARFDPASGVLRRFDPGRPEQEKSSQVAELLTDGDGLWVGTYTGLQHWDTGPEEPLRRAFSAAEGGPEGGIQALYRDRDGAVWIGTGSRGLYRTLRAGAPFERFTASPADPYSLGDNRTVSILQDRSGALWVGTVAAGVSRADLAGGGFGRILHSKAEPDGLQSSMISAILEDRARPGSLWIGSAFAGVQRFDLASGTGPAYRTDPASTASLSNNIVSGLAYDGAGRLWVGTFDGLNRFDERTGAFERVRLGEQKSASNVVSRLIADRNGRLWIGTSGAGVRRLDTASGAVLAVDRAAGLSNDSVGALLEERSGSILVGTDSGLDRYDPATGKVAQLDLGKGQKRIQTLFQDSRGRVWAGTPQALLAIGPPLQSWPVPSGVNAILEAQDGKLWLSTDAGMSVFEPSTGQWQAYTARDGLIEGSFYANAALRARSGVMYFGGFSGGLAAFDPARVRPNTLAPEVAITELLVWNEPVRVGAPRHGVQLATAAGYARDITLSHRHAMFSIEFAALHFADPARNRYAYKLEGFDKEWVATSAARRVATYTNLDPGRYLFRVRAASKDGVWNMDGATLAITITPPFWKTAWFRAACAALLALLLWLSWRWRVRSFVRREQQLESLVQERTRAVQEALSELKVAQQQLVLREKLASIGTLTAGIAHEINNPVNAAHAGAQTLGASIEAFRTYLLELAGGSDADAAVSAAISRRAGELGAQLAVIGEGTARIRQLVRDLLNFARLGEAERKSVAIGDSLLSTVNLVRGQFAGAVDIVCHLDANPQLECAPSLLNQVFMNLAVNACQAIEAAGRGTLVITSRIDGQWLSIDFADDGCGIAAQRLGRVFDPFFTTKGEGEGTGLGLSISLGIVQQHGGTIEVRSTEGQGSTFTVRLPRQA